MIRERDQASQVQLNRNWQKNDENNLTEIFVRRERNNGLSRNFFLLSVVLSASGGEAKKHLPNGKHKEWTLPKLRVREWGRRVKILWILPDSLPSPHPIEHFIFHRLFGTLDDSLPDMGLSDVTVRIGKMSVDANLSDHHAQECLRRLVAARLIPSAGIPSAGDAK